ncbi:winged helix-turn-helix transcriptional regulator [[Mycobacterium] nativiensis]|uniref:Helix-turn-helix domain-containing protein n=1 Tax=[Mycobacterium] nativiensis TaxID=2855503 RepID=A0ABU5XV57_9MYCO|nr:helix-turn-helix domain-containing protein [Mycolicibacter sp. MYC340]MEB3031687.1 helix-turn-helix domain-containing protein [Mycolicibacter sp. MYC340]
MMVGLPMPTNTQPEISGDPVFATLAATGDRWTLLILREVYWGAHRFSQIRRNLGIARTPLSERLSRLVDAGLLERVQYRRNPVRLEYRLAERGLELFPVIVALFRFGERWTPDRSPMEMRHRDCGGAVVIDVRCADCGATVDAKTTDYLH